MPRLVISTAYCIQNILAGTSKHNRQKQPKIDFQFKLQVSYHFYFKEFKISVNGLQLKEELPHRKH
jgi:hypothetical protein